MILPKILPMISLLSNRPDCSATSAPGFKPPGAPEVNPR
jgi:hypothetical protein